MEKHITVLACVYLTLGAFGLIAAGVFFTLVVGGGLLGGLLSGELEPVLITSVVGPFVFLVLSLLSIPAIVGAMGLLRRRHWARILVLVLGLLAIFKFPLGTTLAAYTLWVLLHGEVAALFERDSPAGSPPVSV